MYDMRCKKVEDSRKKIVEITTARGEVKLTNPKNDGNDPERIFAFDLVFDTTS
jgi:hypothetical protein